MDRPYDVITFDCYGTLIDWEAGFRSVVQPLLCRAQTKIDPAAFFARWEDIQFGKLRPWRPYRQILRESLRAVLAEVGVVPTQRSADVLGDSMGLWEPFPDTRPANDPPRKTEHKLQ